MEGMETLIFIMVLTLLIAFLINFLDKKRFEKEIKMEIERLKYENPARFSDLKALAYGYYWQNKEPEDELMKAMVEYVTKIEDESNLFYKKANEMSKKIGYRYGI